LYAILATKFLLQIYDIFYFGPDKSLCARYYIRRKESWLL